MTKADGIRTFYVKDRQGVTDASSQMEAEGVTAKIYALEGLIQTIQADSEENAALWIPFYLYQGEVQVQDEYVHEWIAERSGETPELEWELPTGRQEGVEAWKYNFQNEEPTEEAKKEADSLPILTEIAQKESDVQMILEAKGYGQVVVTISGDNADIMIEAANLTDAQTTQILDIVQNQTGIIPENIIITVSGVSDVFDVVGEEYAE